MLLLDDLFKIHTHGYHVTRNEGVLSIRVPFLAPAAAPNTSVTWNYTTVPQIGLNDRTVPYPRGRVLGGSSSIS